MKIIEIRTRPFNRYITTLNLDHTYFWTVLDKDILLDADLLPDLLFKDQFLLDLVQEHLALANMANIEGILFRSFVALSLGHAQMTSLERENPFPVAPR